MWLVFLNLCTVEGSGNDAGGHGVVPGAGEASGGPGRLCSILPGTGREIKISSTPLGLEGGIL